MTSWNDITTAIAAALGGDRDAGLREMSRCWDQLAAEDHAQRCVLAHYIADLQPDVESEVIWDERALNAFTSVGETDLVPIGIPSTAGLAPSLHLNLGDGYLRAGRVDEARAQLASGLAAVEELGNDECAAMIRSGLEGLRSRLAAS